MRNIIKKLRSKQGESLLETLISILIFTLASIAMFTMCKSANQLNATVKDNAADVNTQMLIVESASGAPTSTGTLTFKFEGWADAETHHWESRKIDVPIAVYGSRSSDTLFSYYHK